MATYKFPNHQAELANPIIEKISTSFSIGDEFVSVHANLNANGNKLYSVHLGMMQNTEGWVDADVQAFAIEKLEDYKVV